MANNDWVPGFDEGKEESLKIRIQTIPEVEGCLVFYLSVYIDTYNSNIFQKRIQKAIDTGFHRLIFNCEGLSYVSSTGIGSFTSFLKAVKPRGGDIVLLQIQTKVYEVFQLLGFSQFFNIKDSLSEAKNFFQTEVKTENEVSFEKIFECPICSKKLKAVKPGRFRCSACKTILAINKSGEVSLG